MWNHVFCPFQWPWVLSSCPLHLTHPFSPYQTNPIALKACSHLQIETLGLFHLHLCRLALLFSCTLCCDVLVGWFITCFLLGFKKSLLAWCSVSYCWLADTCGTECLKIAIFTLLTDLWVGNPGRACPGSSALTRVQLEQLCQRTPARGASYSCLVPWCPLACLSPH